MSTRQRWWLSKIFILLFCLITPPILIYANGYRINWHSWKLERTGLLEIKSEPANALVNINELKAWWGKPKKIVTPVKLKNLRPGNYNVNLSLPGYYEWHKTLTIWPAQTTIVKDIRLFKKSEPQLLAALPTTTLSGAILPLDNRQFNLATKNLTTTSIRALIDEQKLATNWLDTASISLACPLPNGKIAFSSQFELWLANPDTATTELLGRFSQPIVQLICLPNSDNYLIFGQDNGWQVIE
ncbi:MAG TPA: PEGA domain-containing protein, partial [bacterium]|nr:PEGA domain-containing protein [bacterium]